MGKGKRQTKEKVIRSAAAQQGQHKAFLTRAPLGWRQHNLITHTLEQESLPGTRQPFFFSTERHVFAQTAHLTEESRHQGVFLQASSLLEAGESLDISVILMTVTLAII